MFLTICYTITGGLAQMVERALSMREVAGSMPASSIFVILAGSHAFVHKFIFLSTRKL